MFPDFKDFQILRGLGLKSEIWDFLNEQVKDDKIKNLGISVLNSAIDNDDLYQIESASKVGVKIIQIVYNRLNKNAEKKAIPFCLEHNLGIIGRVPLARGHLSGKYEPNHKFPENDKRYFEGKNQTIIIIINSNRYKLSIMCLNKH